MGVNRVVNDITQKLIHTSSPLHAVPSFVTGFSHLTIVRVSIGGTVYPGVQLKNHRRATDTYPCILDTPWYPIHCIITNIAYYIKPTQKYAHSTGKQNLATHYTMICVRGEHNYS